MLTYVTCHIVENHSSFKKEQTLWKLFYKKYKPTPSSCCNTLTRDWKWVKLFDRLFKWVKFVTLQKDPQWDEHESTPAMNKKINLQRQEMKNFGHVGLIYFWSKSFRNQQCS